MKKEMENLVPITRLNRFFSEEEFLMEDAMVRECIEGDGNFTVILYRVDRTTTQFDDLYGEAIEDGIRFLSPVELKVLPKLEAAENKAYNPNGTNRYIQDGKLIFGIYTQQLVELGVEINFGDYVGYPVSETEMRYFSVADDRSKNYDNRHTVMGYKSAYRTVTCASVDKNEFRSI